MSYRMMAIVAAIICFVNIAVLIYAVARIKGRQATAKDQIIGFLVAGPFFYFIDRGLRKRHHKLTSLEYYGLLGMGLFVLFVVVGSIVANWSKYPT